MKAASANSGFFQERPKWENQFESDPSLQRALQYFCTKSTLDRAFPELQALGQEVVSPQVFEYIDDAEKNLPYIVQNDTWGRSLNKLVTSHGWKMLKSMAAEKGIVSTTFSERYLYGAEARVISTAKIYLFSPSSALVSCPLAMTDGCTRLLEVFGSDREDYKEIYNRLTTKNPDKFWTSGQWMTERPGGSDVSRSETVAREINAANGMTKYEIDGFKWFSSATDSEVSALLAKREGHPEEGVTCFLGYIQNGGVRLHRLKEKFGTKPLPTAELELQGMKADIIGKPGHGVRVISTILNITRLHCGISSISGWRRALNIAKSYSSVRSVFGKYLNTIPLHVRVLAEQEALLRGTTFLTFFAASLMGQEENNPNVTHEYIRALLRVVPGLNKAFTCKATISGISECMEAMGGIGYLEHEVEFNIGRLLRDSQVSTIWEGTTNVLADDFVRYSHRDWNTVKASIKWLVHDKLKSIEGGELSELKSIVIQNLQNWIDSVEGFSVAERRRESRKIIFPLAKLIIQTLLLSDVKRDGEIGSKEERVAYLIAREWIDERHGDFSDDYLIVYGDYPSQKIAGKL